jgi:hypothetical protein
MTQKAFIKILDRKRYSYVEEGGKIVVTEVYADLGSLTSIPPGVEFKNERDVNLESLKTLPSGVKFRNRGYVYLDSLETISPGVVFNIEGDRNGRDVYLDSLTGGWLSAWKGNIEGIGSKRLLNKMIADGLFDRK